MTDYIKNLHKQYEIKQIKIDTSLPVQMNLYDRIYVAVYTVYNKRTSSVYTMTEDYNGLGYKISPSINVATFKTRQYADAYHDYIEEIMTCQGRDETAEFHRSLNEANRPQFFDMILSMQMRISKEK